MSGGEPGIRPLLKMLIAELQEHKSARAQERKDDHGYADRVTQLIFDQLCRATLLSTTLPWPRSDALAFLCATLYADPTGARSNEDWSRQLGMSTRTLSRRFENELGISLRSWRRKMRLFKSIELLGGGKDVTGTAFELGYSSSAAFIYAFRTEMGTSPQAYVRKVTR